MHHPDVEIVLLLVKIGSCRTTVAKEGQQMQSDGHL